MLTGKAPFRRDSTVESMHAVLSEEPPDFSSAGHIPPALERVLRRCLEKQPQRRFQSADDLAFAIENAGAGFTASFSSVPAIRPQSLFRAILPWALTGVCVAALVFALLQRKKSSLPVAPHTAAASVRKFDLTLPVSNRQRPDGDSLFPVISPDGRKLAYANAEGLWLRRLDAIAPPVLLTGGENINNPFWSPQSTDIGYFAGRKLFRIGISGGHPALIATTPEMAGTSAAGGAWLGDRIIFTTGGSALLEAPAQGGKVSTALPLAEGERDFHHANPLPGGRGVLFTIHPMAGVADKIAVMDSRGQRKTLLELPGSALWKPVFAWPNHVLFGRHDESRGIWAFSVSLEDLERTDKPFRVSDVGNNPSAADDGTIVYDLATTWAQYGEWQLAWVERSGKILNSVGRALPGLAQPSISPDERQVVALAGESEAETDVWVFDLGDGGASPFTRSQEPEAWPGWGEGGRTIVFSRRGEQGTEVLSAPVDGSGPEHRLAEGNGRISDSGKFLLVSRESANGNVTRGSISITDPQRPFVPFPPQFQRFYNITLSRDDQWLAYSSGESGQFEVYAVRFPSFTNKIHVSRGGGQQPQWHWNGSELFYFNSTGQALMSRKMRSDGALEEPTKLFDLPETIQRGFSWFPTPYTVARDGNRFLMVQKPEEESTSERAAKPNVRVVMNWFEEFRDKK